MDLQNNFSFVTKHCVIFLKAGQEQRIRTDLCFHYMGDGSLCVGWKINLKVAKVILCMHVYVCLVCLHLRWLIVLGKG